MRPENRDGAFLWDMIQACRDILDFASHKTFQDFENDKMLRSAVERQILILGEAARNISDSLKQRTPQIPWKLIIAQRNILAHEYGEVLTERIWNVVQHRIPELLGQLQALLPSPPTGTD
ncbi:MAG TPA: DUF86 domain-containing protein [Anaerohalosphaeraceae bacterium]|nr:DUF86 domain-containing protein [Anaerohalosphaeraceae bacterium]HOL88154.1 DUF86 domain-containing protein [Anaerohalosphaeraceae bacterium]HPP56014.1 DUF86 domain-containing protein [Anaerohalosphaeraceae bacterium]